MQTFSKKRLGEQLLRKGYITQEQLQEALDYQKEKHVRIGEALIALGFLTEDDITKALSQQLKIERIKSLHDAMIEKELVDMVNAAVLSENLFIPMYVMHALDGEADDSADESKKIAVACSDVYNDKINEICLSTYGMEPFFYLGKATEIRRWIEDYVREVRLEKGKSNIAGSLLQKNIYDLNSLDSHSHTVNQVNKMFIEACRKGASDVHMLPEKESVKVYFRTDGDMRLFKEYPHELAGAMISRVKNMAGCNSIENRRPQDGGFEVQVDGRLMDMRLSTVPTALGQKAVVRILDPLMVYRMNLDMLGFSEANKKKFLSFLNSPNGIFIITGPTESGKTTTLYTGIVSRMKEKNGAIAINALEDPIEYRISGVAQTELNEKAGVTIESALKSFVRQDPDIIISPEMREKSTAITAIEAANTGILVAVTAHANDSIAAIVRLLQLGVPNFYVVNTLLGTTAQVLVKKLCKLCSEPYALLIDSEELSGLYGERIGTTLTLKKPVGCPKCDMSGFAGRIPLQEVLVMTPAIRRAVSQAVSGDYDLQQVRDTAVAEGLVPLYYDGVSKVKNGITTIDEVMKKASPASYMQK